MIKPKAVAVIVLLLGAGAGVVDAQAQARYPTPRPSSASPAAHYAQQANVCSTEWGWCPLPPATVITTGFPCACTDPRTGGATRAFNYTQYPWPVSPYLNPHWTP